MNGGDKSAFLNWRVDGLTILDIMRKMKSADGRKELSSKQSVFGEAVRRDEILYSLIEDELNNERNEKENENGKTSDEEN